MKEQLFSEKRLGIRGAVSPSAFTLTEMLVSITVLVLLIVLVTQLLNSAVQVTSGSRNHMDADTQARLVFDRMSTDFSAMLKRPDLDAVFNKVAGNDNFCFYSEAPAYFSGSAATSNPVALVGYRINTSTFQLERLGKGLTWDGTAVNPNPGSVVFLTYPAASPPPAATPTPFPQSTIAVNWPSTANPSSTDADYHVISDQVYRLEFCYLLKTGAYSLVRDSAKAFQDVAAIVVSIAILDNTSRKVGAITSAAPAALVDPTDPELAPAASIPPTLPGKKWSDAAGGSSFATNAGLTQKAAGQVRIYQRSFYLNNNL